MVVTRNDVDLVKNLATGQVTTTNVVRDVTVEAITFDLASKVQTALTTNGTFLAIANPTTAQTTAQVKALTRQNNAVIKLLAGIVLGNPALLQDNTNT